jgi:hypothetical protein
MMRTVAMTRALILSVLAATRAYSRDDKYVLPIKAVLDSAEPRQKPDGSVKFFFGKESTLRIASSLGSVKPHGKARTRRATTSRRAMSLFLLLSWISNKAPRKPARTPW